MNRLRYRLLGIVLVHFTAQVAFPQSTPSLPSARPTEVHLRPDGTIMIQPDPEDRTRVFQILSWEDVQDELELTEGQREAAVGLISEFNERRKQLILDARRGVSIGSQEELLDFLDKENRVVEQQLDELLSPKQSRRLTQVAYRIEVQRMGLANALLVGSLSRVVRIHQNQQSGFRRVASRLEQERNAAILQIEARFEDKLFAELTPEQRTLAENTLGPEFQFKEQTQAQRTFGKAMSALDQRRALAEQKSVK